MKVRIIDLFIKIANGKPVPKKIKYKGEIYKYDSYLKEYGQGPEEDVDNYLSNDFNIGLILNDEVEIIEDKPEEEEIKELPPLEYIKFDFEQSVDDVSSTITYMSTTATTDHDTDLLALVINRVIREVKDLKHRLEVTDKELEEHKKDLFSHNGAPITLTTGLENRGVAIGKISDLGLTLPESQKLADAITKI